jgi:hypothetical protein
LAEHHAETGLIGARVRRKEDLRLLTGRTQFVDDLRFPGIGSYSRIEPVGPGMIGRLVRVRMRRRQVIHREDLAQPHRPSERYPRDERGSRVKTIVSSLVRHSVLVVAVMAWEPSAPIRRRETQAVRPGRPPETASPSTGPQSRIRATLEDDGPA